MIALKSYQQEAVEGLTSDTYRLLKTPGGRQKMVFKAPTGAGKTVTMAAYLNRLCEELPDKIDLPKRQVAFIWIAPNQLHLQSYRALTHYFSELRSIKPIQFEDVTEGKLKPNEVLFLNWQSINKEGNLYIQERETDKTLLSYINQARLDDTEIVVILDEAQLFATKGKSAQELLQKIYAKIEIDVSATPLFHTDYGHVVRRTDVVDAEMIKKGIVLNPKLDAYTQMGRSLEEVLLELALNKKNEIKTAYDSQGVPINPLLLIQLPNDSKSESIRDLEIKQQVQAWLEVKGITTSNNRLAVWLSNEKTNLDEIEKHDSMVDVLLFKQGISLGWDCPRAAVLLIFREIQQETFTIQTVGRILRMPEQKHYSDPLLNYGYVYTDLSKDQIIIVQDEMDYIARNKAIRIPEYRPIGLTSYSINTRLTRNRLSSKFRLCLFEAAEAYFGVTRTTGETDGDSTYHFNAAQLKKRLIELDVTKIEISIPKDVQLVVEVGATQVDATEKFAKTQAELDILFRQFCRNHVGSYAKVDSTPVLEMALKLFFEEYLAINEFAATKIILFEQNKPRFIEAIDQALAKHELLLQQKASEATKAIEETIWEVPTEKAYNEYYQEKSAAKHVLQKYFEYRAASNPEINFTKFLESFADQLDWWYKNGDKNKEDFAVVYDDRYGVKRSFYVDYIIKIKNGPIALFDTKTPDSEPEFCNKHNALHQYVQAQNKLGKKLIGGIIVPKEAGVWKYCENPITNAKDTTGWISFDPAYHVSKS